ncbi:hypothetical protein SAMN05444274_10461 [Mariniphaga anaerophila]|uniref:VOC domain-containing protein n=1 Tax=Mariniphaga anaerophila TaxID=1484053 RepID=A0A1M4ZTE6_9BACT|nr:VOC family protein [Mariniphaga anaerophila]SHF21319.1 hypothetical protein SAMN05444274_10461 [Mariniphaga anaerophila]
MQKLIITIKKALTIFLGVMLLSITEMLAQDIKRPPVWGVAKMTFLVSDFNIARSFYGDFLGYEEAFSYHTDLGKVISFKVNDRQFLEFVEDSQIKRKNSFVSVSFHCDDISGMEAYLKSREINILKEHGLDNAGNEVLSIQSTEFYQIEFINFTKSGLHKRTATRFLGKERVANRLHHAGLYVSDVAKADYLFRDILGFWEMWRFKTANDIRPNFIYMGIPDCIENIEYLVTDDSNTSHPCFKVEDMQEMIYVLKERSGGRKIPRPIIGKGNRWLLNMKNEDNTKVEFTESFTVR